MKFFMEKNKDEGHRVTIHIPKIIVNNAIFRELIEISKKIKMNGFRKGKIPIQIVQKKYGETVYYDVFKILMQKFFYEFTEKKKIKIIGSPKYFINSDTEKNKSYFEYSVNYELYPNFEIKDIEKIKVKTMNVIITDDDVKKKIEEYKAKKNIWHVIDKPIKPHDRITIHYSIYEKNKKIDTLDKKNIVFIVSDNTLLSILNEKVINHVTNDIIFFKIKTREYYPEKKLQDTEIVFKVKIVKIEKKISLESNKVQKKETEEKIFTERDCENIKYNLQNITNTIIQKKLEEKIIVKIIKKNPILIPPILFQEEKEILYKKQKQEYEENNNLLEKKYYFDLHFIAKKRLYNTIILEKVISDNQFSQNQQNIEKIELQKQAMLWIIEKIQIIKYDWTFNHFLQHNWENDEELFI